MISRVSGLLCKKLPSGVIVDVSGVGYEIFLTLPAIAQLPAEDKKVSFWIHTKVREDQIALYGFSCWAEKLVFELLMQVSGIGSKVAMAMLSSLSTVEIFNCVKDQDYRPLLVVPGIGKRTAEKIVFELENKIDRFPELDLYQQDGEPGSLLLNGSTPLFSEAKTVVSPWDKQLKNDLVSALENFGFKEKEVEPVVRQVLEQSDHRDLSELIKEALVFIKKQGTKDNAKNITSVSNKKARKENINRLF